MEFAVEGEQARAEDEYCNYTIFRSYKWAKKFIKEGKKSFNLSYVSLENVDFFKNLYTIKNRVRKSLKIAHFFNLLRTGLVDISTTSVSYYFGIVSGVILYVEYRKHSFKNTSKSTPNSPN